MRPFNVGLVALLLMLVSACDGRDMPQSVSSATAPTTIVLLGQVTDRTTSAPVSGAIVRLDGRQMAITDSSGSYTSAGWGVMTFVEANNYATDYRYIRGTPHNVHLYPIRRITAGDSTSVTVAPDDTLCVNNMQDSPGKYSLTGRLDIGDSSITYAFADGYETHTRYIRGNPAQSFRLRRIERILGGQSWSVTVHPDDSLCFNNFQDPSFGLPGSQFLCRTVRVVAQSEGMLTIEAVSTVERSHPPLRSRGAG